MNRTCLTLSCHESTCGNSSLIPTRSNSKSRLDCVCGKLPPLQKLKSVCIGGSKGGRQGRAPPPWGSKFFHFHAVFGKKIENNSTFGSWRTPLGKILDPPLVWAILNDIFPHVFSLNFTRLWKHPREF